MRAEGRVIVAASSVEAGRYNNQLSLFAVAVTCSDESEGPFTKQVWMYAAGGGDNSGWQQLGNRAAP